MHAFERDAIAFIVGESIIAPDVRAQLPYVAVVRTTRDRDGQTTHFEVTSGAPGIVSRDAELAADLDIDAYGAVSAYLSVTDGRLSTLAFDASGAHWPASPRVLGIIPWPKP